MLNSKKLLPLLLLTVAANAFALDTPTEDFIDNGDGTVTHKKTGLIWQRCAFKQTWNATNSTCDGTSTAIPYSEAVGQTSNFAGYSDWRMPRIDELTSIIEYGSNPRINNVIFPNLPYQIGNSNYGGMGYIVYNQIFWSSSLSPSSSSSTNTVNFQTGVTTYDATVNTLEPQSFTNYNRSVRFVRGGRVLNSLGEYTPFSDFIDNDNGTVTHKTTNLTWKRCTIGQTWNGFTCNGTATQISYDSALLMNSTAGNNDWRVPSVSELMTIIEFSKSNPAINSAIFPNTISNIYLSITENTTDTFWGINLWDGGTNQFFPKTTNKGYVRLVRGKWTAPTTITTTTITSTSIDLSSIINASSPQIQQNSNITYTATAQNNGTGTANNVFLKFYMPPRWTNYVSLPSDCSFNGTTTVCNVGSLAAGSSVSRSITVSFSKFRGATSVGAFAGSDETDTNKANNMSRMITTVTK